MKTEFTDDTLNKAIESNFTEDEGLRKFNDCFLEKTGFVTSDGKLNIDAALAKLPPSFAKPIVEHCQANIILKYTTESVQDFSTCYHLGTQRHISIIDDEVFSVSRHLVVLGTSFAKQVLLV